MAKEKDDIASVPTSKCKIFTSKLKHKQPTRLKG